MNNPRILICSCSDSETRKQEMLNMICTHELYASKHDGIDQLYEIRHTDKSNKPQYEKLLMLSEHIDDGYDYLMWIDDDAGFIKFDEDFRDKLPSDDKLFYFTRARKVFRGWRTKERVYLNSGVFFVKCCKESKDILLNMYAKRGTVDTILCDQPMLIKWYFANQEKCTLIDPIYFNSFPHVTEEGWVCKTSDKSLIVHLVGSQKEFKNEYFPERKL